DVTANGGIYANLNGIITTADPGVYDSINYFPGILGDTLSVYNTNVPFSIESAADLSAIYLGNAQNGVQGIKANVDLSNAPYSSTLSIYDDADTVGRTALITGNSVTGLASAPIFFSNLNELIVGGGSGSNTFAVTDTTGLAIVLVTNS